MDHFKNPFDNFDTNQKLNILIEIEKSCEQLLITKNKEKLRNK